MKKTIFFMTLMIGVVSASERPIDVRLFEEYLTKPVGFECAGVDQVYLFSLAFDDVKYKKNMKYLGAGVMIERDDNFAQVLTAKHIIDAAQKKAILVLQARDAGKESFYYHGILIESTEKDFALIAVGKSGFNLVDKREVKEYLSRRHVQIEPKRVLSTDPYRSITHLRSINSAKSHRVLGRFIEVELATGKRSDFIILNKKSFPGESGSCFIDEHNNLYVLVARSSPANMSSRIKNMTMRAVEISHPGEPFDGSYSVLIGPFDLNKEYIATEEGVTARQ